MIATICPTEKHINSSFLSLKEEHIQAYVAGYLRKIEVRDKTQGERVIQVFQDSDLNKLMGTAIYGGRTYVEGGGWYYLGKRHF